MQQYSIYPVKGNAARDYLLLLGCSIGREIMSIPDYLQVVPTSGNNEVMYAAMRNDEKKFRMQYYLTARWRVIVPAEYQPSFSEIMKAYNLNEWLAESIIGSYGLVCQLMQGIPVQDSVAALALKRIANYTGHPYDLQNVRIVLGNSDAEFTVSGGTATKQ